MKQLSDEISVGLEGHVKILGYDDGQDEPVVLLDKRNAIHREHASILIARGMAGRDNGAIYSLALGTGGATIDPTGGITYATPSVTGAASLNTQVYLEVVNDNQSAPDGNSLAVQHISGTLFSDVVVRMVVGKDEPFGQAATDSQTGANINSDSFTFDELGLFTEDGLLVTHIVFSPVKKSTNRVLEFVYTIRVTINP